MSVETDTDVVIVGGGFAGIGSAIALADLGLRVRVLERRSEVSEIGAGVNMGPNSVRVLKALDVFDEVEACGFRPQHYLIRDATDGRELARQNVSTTFEVRYGSPAFVIHRSALLQILLRRAVSAGVDVCTDSEVVDVTSDGAGAVATTARGARYTARIVVGADGVRSRTRLRLSDDELVPDGFVAFRGTLPATELPRSLEPGAVTLWIAPDGHMTQYPIDDPSSGVPTISHAVVYRPLDTVPGGIPVGTAAGLLAATQGWVDDLRFVIAKLPKEHHWVMYDREPIHQWVDGRLVLIGDAAHPMLQYLGQGGAQAFEDGFILAREIDRHSSNSRDCDWDAALRAFNDRRVERVARVQRNARLFGQTTHVSGLARTIRDAAFLLREPANFSYLDWLYQADSI